MRQRIYLYIVGLLALLLSCQKGPAPEPAVPDLPQYATGEKTGRITYQLLIYSFADSDGDGIGDFNGITAHLDYLDALGVSAIWLSPAHPADSYHGYDVTDYAALNPDYGTEADFERMVKAAHDKGIKVYMDYVLNHSGKGHPWFKEAVADASSPYRNYYLIGDNPSSDYRSFPMLAGYTYNKDEWHAASSGSPQFTLTSTTEPVTSGNASWNLWMWTPGGEGKEVKLKANGEDAYYAVVEISGKTGILVRKASNWDAGSKFGAPEKDFSLTEGTPVQLVSEGGDMFFTGSGRYRIDLSHVSTQTVWFMGAFGSWMPDLNYGDVSQAESNACFRDIAASADKWIGLGIDGFRLDAVKHICGGMNSFNNANNVTLLKKWYDRCNARFRESHDSDIYMVGEAWLGAAEVAAYYKALPACFEFDFWTRLEWVLNQRVGCYFAKDLLEYRQKYATGRADFIAATKLSNHDETRTASRLGRDEAKMKQAAAFLLSAEGEPYIYQGEEVGYWGKDSDDGGSDESVRAPLVWEKGGSVPVKLLAGKVDTGMLATESLSIPAQEADANSLLWVYLTWTKARNSIPALSGKMSAHPTYNSSNTLQSAVACWYMTATDGQKALVVHNVGAEALVLDFPDDDLSHPLVTLGTVSASGTQLSIGPNSSAVYQQ